MSRPSRVDLICRPTPLHRLPRLSEDLGVDLWIKRDDLTGFAGSGNKGRKIEYLIAEAVAQGAEIVVCQGAVQSNFIRQLGAACAMMGIVCEAVVMEMPHYAAAGKPPAPPSGGRGNLILGELFGIVMHRFPDDDWDVLDAHADDLVAQRRAEGKRVMKINIGGSSPVGALSFMEAGEEIDRQASAPFDFLVTSSSSGSTHAGLAYHFHGSLTKVIGISADPDPDDELALDVVDLCGQLNDLIGGTKVLSRSEIDLRMGYHGEAYGIPSPEGMAAIQRFARREGIVLDPVYSGKAAAGLFDLIEKGEVGGRVLFWHTGGMPTLFALDPLRSNDSR